MPAKNLKGFSIIELMVVVTCIGILALLGVPGIVLQKKITEATVVANDLRVFAEAVEFYTTTEGSYPATMTYTSMPNAVRDYVPSVWKDGTYNWVYVNIDQKLIGIWVNDATFTAEQGLKMDTLIDDGNVATGDVLCSTGSGYWYLFVLN